MSRPKLPPGSAKNKLIQIRVTPKQKRLLHDLAAKRGKSMSDFVLGILMPVVEQPEVNPLTRNYKYSDPRRPKITRGAA